MFAPKSTATGAALAALALSVAMATPAAAQVNCYGIDKQANVNLCAGISPDGSLNQVGASAYTPAGNGGQVTYDLNTEATTVTGTYQGFSGTISGSPAPNDTYYGAQYTFGF